MGYDVDLMKTRPTMPEEFLDVTTTTTAIEGNVAENSKRVYFNPHSAFNYNVEVTSSDLSPESIASNAKVYDVKATGKNLSTGMKETINNIQMSSKTTEETPPNNLVSQTTNSAVAKTTSSNVQLHEDDGYDSKTIFPVTPNAPMQETKSPKIASPMSSDSKDTDKSLKEELFSGNKHSVSNLRICKY